MRHRNKRSKLSIMTAHRKAMLRATVANLFKYQRIETSLARAKETRRLAEHVITIAKTDTVAARRRVYAVIADRDQVKKLFSEIVPLFKDRTSGFTRIIHTGFRRGDGADMALLELTEKKIAQKTPAKKAKKSEEPKTGAGETKPRDAAGKDLAHEGAAGEVGKAAKEEKKEPRVKALPKNKPGLEEEKRSEKAKSEDKKMADNRGFMKNIRGLFRKRGDF